MARGWVDATWYDDAGPARLVRTALAPVAAAYGAVMALRNAWYDRASRVHATAVPALAIGNLSVGGTGKTPVAAWCAATLRARGATPAIVLRGYGDDEPAVHRILNPAVPVVATPDRVLGAARARAAGADVVVLDDAFQHRRAARVADVVLVSADRFRPDLGVLPAGPWRESPRGLVRATVVVITRKAASPEAARAVARWVAQHAPAVPVAQVHLVPDALVPHGGAGAVTGAGPAATVPLTSLAGQAVLVAAGIGDPQAFARQVATGGGASVTLRAFPDHHPFPDADIAALAREAGDRPVVVTLKDAVKLSPRWPRTAPPLWYVSQRVVVEDGGAALDGALAAVLAARTHSPVVPAD